MTAVAPNKFPGYCVACTQRVAAGEGIRRPPLPGSVRWRTFHLGCDPGEELPAEPHAEKYFDVAENRWKFRAVFPERAELPSEPVAETPESRVAEEEYVAAETLAESMQRELDEAHAAISKLWDDRVPALVAAELASHKKTSINVGELPPIVLDHKHAMLEQIVMAVVAGASPLLVGPAGSGKTTLAQQVADVLHRPFYMAARVTSEYKLVGFIDANGKCVRTQFRDAYEKGGVFLFDEIDASDPDALTAFNAALANGVCDFPDGMVKRHKDFAAIAAGNTFGRGADRQYVGRNQLDAATLDRFSTFEIDYDEALELALAQNDTWTRYVQSVRKAIATEKVRHVVSPRASITGARLLAAGMDRKAVEEATVWKGLDETTKARVTAAMKKGF